MIHVSAPGKLMIAGEWAVLEGYKCIVAAVNRRVHSIVEPLSEDYISINLDDFQIDGARFTWDGTHLVPLEAYQIDAEKLKFTKESIGVALRFLQENGIKFRPFKLRTYGEETQINEKKVGFGSSAAAVVAIIVSVLDFHCYRAAKEDIYKLAAIAHYYAQGKAGSAFDVAASTYGGIIAYRRFDPAWLSQEIESGEKLCAIVRRKWPGFFVEELPFPEGMHLAVAWTGKSASTTEMMKQMAAFKAANPAEYQAIYDGIGHVVEDMAGAWKSGIKEDIINCVRKNRALLSKLTKEAGVEIETPALAELAGIAEARGAAGKLSGAGGGDCGFAVLFNNEKNSVEKAFKEAGLYPLDVKIDAGVN